MTRIIVAFVIMLRICLKKGQQPTIGVKDNKQSIQKSETCI